MGETVGDSDARVDGIPEELSADRVHATLGSEHRRRLLAELSAAGGSVPIDDLAARIADPGGDDRDDAVHRVRIGVYHNHAPRLADDGYVHYDVDDGLVELTRRGTVLAGLLAA